jgi:hypothetical protein
MPVRPAVAGHIKREFQPGPHSQLVEGGAQVVLHYLLAGERLGVATRQNRSKRFAKCSLINNVI